MTATLTIENAVPLASSTTLGLGGRARHFVDAADDETVAAAVEWAKARGLPLLILGGGSNVVVADDGFPGVVVRIRSRGLRLTPDGARVLVDAAAGEPWDALVQTAVSRDLAGIECLAGIPGLVGATPIQNVGAYGQEVAETIDAVRALDRVSGNIVQMGPGACELGYRDSMFKRNPEAYVVLGVTFALRPNALPTLRYPELERAIVTRVGSRRPTLAEVSEVVIALRKSKSMVIDGGDPNRRSVGSFFVNPVLAPARVADVVHRAIAAGRARVPSDVPQFPASDGRIKLSAGWLVENAGFVRGYRRGGVGISSNHALALVHHGDGSTDELVRLARDVRDAVKARFDVALFPEPTLVGVAL